MRIELDDIVDGPTANVQHLTEHLIRFQFTQPRDVSGYHQLILDGSDNTDVLSPGAPNREGIRSNFEQVRRTVADTFEAHRNCDLFRQRGIDTPAAFLRFNLEHCCRPRFVYTNGQSLVSLLALEGDAVETALHSSVRDYLTFNSEYEYGRLIDPETVGRYASLSAAETRIGRHLSRLQVTALPMIRGSEQRTVLLQPAGEGRRDPQGYALSTNLLYHDGGVLRWRLGPEEPYTSLNRLDLDGFRAATCATCRHFLFSGMSRDMSHGSKGYCGRRLEQARTSGLPRQGMETDPPFATIVSVFDTCADHSFVADEQREYPYAPPAP